MAYKILRRITMSCPDHGWPHTIWPGGLHNVEDYLTGKIKKHEFTRKLGEDRMIHVHTNKCGAGILHLSRQ